MHRLLSSRARSDRRATGESGYTVLEVTIASALLLVALATLIGAMASSNESTAFAAERNRSLDDLRHMAAVFGKDVRQASRITIATQTEIAFDTIVDGEVTPVRWRATETQLERYVGSSTTPQVFVVALTTPAVFSYAGEVNLSNMTRVRLVAATQPNPKHPPVVLESEVEMRNAR